MCECGCTLNDVKYTFPGPGKVLYILTLSGECKNCDAPPGITIERIKPDHILYAEYKRGEFTDGPLKFEQWADSEGVAIITGFRQHEFVKALMSHLVDVSSADMGEDGLIDESGAEVILEEMYDDSQVKPHIVEPVKVN